jgi:excisionase family DNA binding protein
MGDASPTQAELPAFLTVDEAAILLRVNRKTLYESLRLGQVPGVMRVGNALRIRRAALLESSPGKGRDTAPRGHHER